jgi:heptose I phosphotransferase
VITLCQALQDRFSGEDAFDQVFAAEGKIYRDFKGRKTLRFEHAGKGYFLKIHPGVGWGEIIKSLLSFKAPVLGAKDERDAILALEQIGVQTMTIAGYGARGRSPATLQSFIITEEIEDSISLEELVLEGKYQFLSPVMKRSLIKKVAEIARTMHQGGVNHRDFYICHFLLSRSWLEMNRSDVEPPLYVIDLHRTQVRSTVPHRWLEKDLAGLHFSSMDAGLSVMDRLRFISMYEGESFRQDVDPSSLWPRIDKMALKLHQKFHRRKDQ